MWHYYNPYDPTDLMCMYYTLQDDMTREEQEEFCRIMVRMYMYMAVALIVFLAILAVISLGAFSNS